jgi:hypothetical protein
LPHIWAERFDVTSLAFGVNGLECQARFATAAGACDDRQFPQRKINIDPFEIVLACPTNLNAILRDWRSEMFCARSLRTHWKYSLPVKRFANFVDNLCAKRGAPCQSNARIASPAGRRLQQLFFKARHQLLALFLQFLRDHAAERVEKGLVRGKFFLPFLVIDSEKLGHGCVIDV